MNDARIFDTHCHLNQERFHDDLPQVLERAHQAGVGEFTVIGFDRESSRAAVALAEPERGIYAAVGIHPHDAASWSAATEAELRAMLAAPGIVALGEIGLDFFRDLSPRDAQYTAFRAQLDLAAELSLPIVVHTRESVTASLDVLEPFANAGLRGIMHCWSGTAEEARRARSFGFLLGIGGVLTYKKVGELQDVVRESPLESLVLETDCPYLPPVPHRGQRNEPSYLPLVAQRLAELRAEAVDSIAAVTTANARRLFRLPNPTSHR